MRTPEDKPKRSLLRRAAGGTWGVLRIFLLIDAAKWLCSRFGFAISHAFSMLRQWVSDVRGNRDKAREMTYRQFLRHHGLNSKRAIRRKKKQLTLEVGFMLALLAWEVAMLLQSTVFMVRLQVVLSGVVLLSLLYLRSWVLSILVRGEYVRCQRWFFGLPLLFSGKP